MEDDKKYLKRAIDLARESGKQGGFPAGAVLAKDGRVISEGISIGWKIHDPTSHAEIAVIRDTCKKLKTYNLEGAVIYASIQSCLMCFSAAHWANISKIVFACRKTPEMVSKNYFEGNTDNEKINLENNNKIELLFIPYYEKEVLNIIYEWEKKFNNNLK